MSELVSTLEFFGVLAMAIEMGFETLFSLPFIEAYFKAHKERAYIKRLAVLAFCLGLCGVLYTLAPADGGLFLERTFGQKVPVFDVLLTGLILAGGSRAVHDVLKRVGGAAAKREDAAR